VWNIPLPKLKVVPYIFNTQLLWRMLFSYILYFIFLVATFIFVIFIVLFVIARIAYIHPVYGAGVQTHTLLIMSRLSAFTTRPWLLAKFSFILNFATNAIEAKSNVISKKLFKYSNRFDQLHCIAIRGFWWNRTVCFSKPLVPLCNLRDDRIDLENDRMDQRNS
jgi:hypothetical protein